MNLPGDVKKLWYFVQLCMQQAVVLYVLSPSLAWGLNFQWDLLSREFWNPGVAVASSVHVGMAGDTVLGLAHSVNSNEIVKGDSSHCMISALWCLSSVNVFVLSKVAINKPRATSSKSIVLYSSVNLGRLSPAVL